MYYRSFKEASVAFSQGILPIELSRMCIKRAKYLGVLNAFTELFNEVQHISNENKSPIDGIPIVVKDNFCLEGRKTTCGSAMLTNFIAPYTAHVVQDVVNAGGIIIGKTNLDEFAMGSGCVDSVHGPTYNAWSISSDGVLDEEPLIAGGSSGGSAVAIASGCCLAALGSDTGGSIRIPAAWNGIVGLKPTYGALSRYGLISLVNSLDTPGIMTKNVTDCFTLFKILVEAAHLRPSMDSTHVLGRVLPMDPNIAGISVGIPAEYRCVDMSDEIIEAWSLVTDLLEDEGTDVNIKSVSLPHTCYSNSCYGVLNPCEVASNMARYDGLEFGLRSCENETSIEAMFSDSRQKGFGPAVKGRILAGNYFLLKDNYDKYFMKAMKIRRLIFDDFNTVFKDGIDMLLTPVTLCDAPTYSQYISQDNMTQTMLHDYCTQPANMAGLPAVTIPVALSQRGLPIGIQIIGQKWAESSILALAKWIENRVEFSQCNSRVNKIIL